MSSNSRTYRNFFSALSSVFVVDQAIKFLFIVKFPGYAVRNYDSMSGIPYDNYVALAILGFVMFLMWYFKEGFEKYFGGEFAFIIGMFFGGLLGNYFDRIYRGFVVDYIFFFNLFYFNFSDVAIFLGAVVISLKIIYK